MSVESMVAVQKQFKSQQFEQHSRLGVWHRHAGRKVRVYRREPTHVFQVVRGSRDNSAGDAAS